MLARTVDYIDHSFGFNSAVEAALVAIRSAKTEAVCNLPNVRSQSFLLVAFLRSCSQTPLCRFHFCYIGNRYRQAHGAIFGFHCRARNPEQFRR